MLSGDILYALVSLIASVAILFVQVTNLRDRRPPFAVDRPSSYFRLRDCLSRNWTNIIAYLGALPVTALFLIVCWRSQDAVIGIVGDFGPKIINTFLPASFHEAVIGAFGKYFDFVSYLSPLLLLLAFLFLFAPYVNRVVFGIQNTFIRSIGVEDKIDDAATAAARTVLRTSSIATYEAFRERAESKLKITVALLPELSGANDEFKIAYGLMQAAEPDAKRYGIELALRIVLGQMEICPRVDISTLPANSEYNLTQVVLAVLGFVCLTALFIVVSARDNGAQVVVSQVWSPYLFEWIHSVSSSTVQALRYLFCFVLPLYLGFFIFLARRKRDETPDTILDCARAAALQQITLALVFSFTFCFLDSLEVIAGIQAQASPKETPYSVATPKFWFDVITYSLLPTLALSGWLIARYRFGLRGVALGCVLVAASAICPALQAFGYEWYTGNWRGLYWYWMALGLWITLALILSGTIDKGLMRKGLADRLEAA